MRQTSAQHLFYLMVICLGCASCNQGGPDLVVPTSGSSANQNKLTDRETEEEKRRNQTNDDADKKQPESAFPGSRVIDISEDSDFDDEDFEDEDDERTNNSDCRFFTTTSNLPLTEKPTNFSNTDTVINHFPPAEYPMPVQKTFQGEWNGDSYNLMAMVDIKISYSAHDPYETKWKTALPESQEDPLYERRYYSVTIVNAESSDCTVTYIKDER